MSFQQRPQKRGNSILGILGTLATIGGMVTGTPWLSALGTVSHGADALINGGGGYGGGGSVEQQTGGALGTVLSGLKDAWGKITDNNIAKTPTQQAAEKMQRIADNVGADNPKWDWSFIPSAGSNWVTGGARWRNGQYVMY